ncbi:hypothetical protein C6988_01425 [Nitrosopumilus sp. b1]|uniref:hypothetical protein n=1 Tax=Nitrosopumilus sp. b1 TaxID=2109907 RepID=UPI0015F492F2|nr:hypothetical protein [Nitrosopumilus sp. b1]KAF6243853.1 hypothetical protein C6988_01425 [Nitrosopumilus sp. b1]
MDKYLLVVLMFLIAGMGIAITKDPPELILFYAMLAGSIVVIMYGSLKSRYDRKQAKRKEREERRNKKSKK